MVIHFLKTNRYASWVLALLRIYLGVLWIEGGWHKIMIGFDATGYLNNAIKNPVIDKATKELLYPNFTAFLEYVALPSVKVINVMIAYGEFLVGLGLILGALTTVAVFFGLLMNFMFLFAGTISHNPWYVLIGVIILVTGTNAGKLGVDYYLLPLLQKAMKKWTKKKPV